MRSSERSCTIIDTHLNRPVAVKFLSEELADPTDPPPLHNA
jgi:hypothetical protein